MLKKLIFFINLLVLQLYLAIALAANLFTNYLGEAVSSDTLIVGSHYEMWREFGFDRELPRGMEFLDSSVFKSKHSVSRAIRDIKRYSNDELGKSSIGTMQRSAEEFNTLQESTAGDLNLLSVKYRRIIVMGHYTNNPAYLQQYLSQYKLGEAEKFVTTTVDLREAVQGVAPMLEENGMLDIVSCNSCLNSNVIRNGLNAANTGRTTRIRMFKSEVEDATWQPGNGKTVFLDQSTKQATAISSDDFYRTGRIIGVDGLGEDAEYHASQGFTENDSLLDRVLDARLHNSATGEYTEPSDNGFDWTCQVTPP